VSEGFEDFCGSAPERSEGRKKLRRARLPQEQPSVPANKQPETVGCGEHSARE